MGVRTEYGAAPIASEDGLKLSLSHSEDVGLVAVAVDPVGVDIESRHAAARLKDDLSAVAEISLSAAESEYYRSLGTSGRRDFVLRAWTRKEAWLKSKGQGIASRALHELDVSEGELGQTRLVSIDLPSAQIAFALGSRSARYVWRTLYES